MVVRDAHAHRDGVVFRVNHALEVEAFCVGWTLVERVDILTVDARRSVGARVTVVIRARVRYVRRAQDGVARVQRARVGVVVIDWGARDTDRVITHLCAITDIVVVAARAVGLGSINTLQGETSGCSTRELGTIHIDGTRRRHDGLVDASTVRKTIVHSG